MKNKLILVSFLLVGVYAQNIEHFDQGQNVGASGPLANKFDNGIDYQQQQQHSPNFNLDDLFQMLDPSYRQKRTANEIVDSTDELYEIFLREPLPSTVNLETTPPWAIQILALLMKLREKCVQIQNTRKPRPGRRSMDDDIYFERSRPPLSPRRGKKSLLKPRMGRSGDD